MKRIVFFLATVLVCRSSHAEMLLAEFEFTQPGTVTLPANYHFSVRNYHLPNQPIAVWSDTLNSVPLTQTASPELVAQFNAITTNHPSQDRRVFPRNGTFSLPFFIDRPFDAIWSEDADPSDGFRAEAFVPPVVPVDRLSPYW